MTDQPSVQEKPPFISRELRPEKYRRITGPGFTQLIPRKFFFDVSRDRRAELVEAMRAHRKLFTGHRRELRNSAKLVADALEAEPFDQAALEAAIQEFRGKSVQLIDEGSRVGTTFFAMLTDEERKQLGKRIRQRAEGRRKKKKKKK
jgi:Spy/CpxP family protein refolding chaperone